MLSFSVSSFERRLFLLAMAKLGDYLSPYWVSVLHRSERRGVPRVGGLPGVFRGVARAHLWRRARLPQPGLSFS